MTNTHSTQQAHQPPAEATTPATAAALDVAREFTAAARSDSAPYRATVRQWQAWCAETGHTALPASEQALLRWVHSQYPNWSSKYVKVKGTHIRAWHVENGFLDPRGEKWFTYVARLTRYLGEHKEEQKVDAMTVQELHAVNAVFRERLFTADTDTVRARGAIAASVLVNAPLWAGRTVKKHAPAATPPARSDADGNTRSEPRERSEPCPVSTVRLADTRVHANGDVTVTLDGRGVLFAAARHPYLVRCIRDAITLTRTRDDAVDVSPFTVTDAVRHRLRRHFTRPATRETTGVGAEHGSVAIRTPTLYQAMSPLELEWFLRTLHPGAVRALTSSAILLTGTHLARRHQDLRELSLTHIHTTPGRPGQPAQPSHITYVQPKSKTDPTGTGVTKTLHHTNPNHDCTTDQPCHSECPVRVLTDHITYQREVAHRNDGPLFTKATRGTATRDATTSTPANTPPAITSAAWNHTLTQTWQTAGLPHTKRITSRSMRVTGATLAHQGGASIPDICALTDHTNPENARTYIRTRNPHRHHITLSEDNPK